MTTVKTLLAIGAAVSLSAVMAAPAAATPGTVPQDSASVNILPRTESVRGFSFTWAGNPAASTMSPALFPIDTDLDGTPDLQAYCIELRVHARYDTSALVTGWDGFVGTNAFAGDDAVRNSIGWIVQNSYPSVDLEDLASAAGVDAALDERVAIAATQAAIWHFSDGIRGAKLDDSRATKENRSTFTKIYAYLTGPANVGLPEKAVSASVELALSDGARQSGTAGQRLGPIVLRTDQDSVEVIVQSDFPVIDVAGKKLDLSAVADGTAMYIDVPKSAKAGTAHLSTSARQTGMTGKLITPPKSARSTAGSQAGGKAGGPAGGKAAEKLGAGSVSTGNHGQTLILVESTEASDAAEISVTWAPAPAVPTPTPSPTPEETTPPPTPTPEATTPPPTPTPTPTPEATTPPSPTPEETTPAPSPEQSTPPASPSPTPTPTPNPTPEESTPPVEPELCVDEDGTAVINPVTGETYPADAPECAPAPVPSPPPASPPEPASPPAPVSAPPAATPSAPVASAPAPVSTLPASSPPPSSQNEQLANTGASVGGLAALAAALVGLGVLAIRRYSAA